MAVLYLLPMAKKLARRKESEFDALARLIKSESDDIRKHMATKGDIADVRKDISGIRKDIAGIMVELRDIKARLTVIEEATENHAHYSKEIDHAFERIAAIEKRLGISKR